MRRRLPVIIVAILFILLDDDSNQVESLEPVTTSVAVGTAVLSSAFIAGYTTLKCKFYECCEDNWIKPNITGLEKALQSRLHGQHLVLESVVKAIKGHMRNKDPPKALALSFHGWTGAGKNFVSGIVAEHVMKAGLNSQFVHLFVSTLHFPHQSKIETYKDQLRDWIKGNVSECSRSMFIFDEMDKMPKGLIDTVKPYLDHYPDINGVNYRKTIFIFLSNTGGNAITKRTLKHWDDGGRREELTLKNMEEIINMEAFNEEGGLWHSSLIEKNLINVFIPFLPLERRHIKMCIQDDLRMKGYPVTDEVLSKVADEMQYFPADTKLFSKTGCKRVSQKVDLIIEEMEFDSPHP